MRTTLYTRLAWMCLIFLAHHIATNSINILSIFPFQDKTNIPQLISQCESGDAISTYEAIKSLQLYPLDQYTKTDKDRIASLVLSETAHRDKIIKLAGFLQLRTALKTLLADKPKSKAIKQSINFALVRAGDSEKSRILIKTVREQEVNDRFIDEILSSLIYTRNKEVYDFLLEQIMLDQLNCHPSDADTGGEINCAFRIIEAIAPHIIDFPAKNGPIGLEVEDYSQCLVRVREWVGENESGYKINKGTY